jgi:hypothetical protein
MEIEEEKLKTTSQICFSFVVFFFRFAGVPFNINQISNIYAIYIITVVICSCTTFVGLLADMYIHMDDLGHIMTSMRVLIPLMNTLFIYFYCR